MYKTSIISIFVFIILSEATISPEKVRKKSSKSPTLVTGPRAETVFELGLVNKEPSANDIVIYSGSYHENVSSRRLNGTIMGFVTPWNAHGYKVATIFSKKMDTLSPVWFQIVKHGNDYKLNGVHDVDSRWIENVKTNGFTDQKSLQVLPRFLFENFNDNDFSYLLSSEEEMLKLSKLLRKTCRIHKFDGIVLEYWLQLSSRFESKLLKKLTLYISNSLAEHNLKLILVIPPFRPQLGNIFNSNHMDALYKYVHAFVLMTYDYSTVQRPGANSPLRWIKKSVEHIAPQNGSNVAEKRKKILMGLNMYGNDYTPDGGSAIIGSQYLDLLRNVKRLQYDEHNGENFFETKTNSGRHYVFYPTLYSINERIELANQMGVGISIWELGQGLDYFYELF